MTADVPARRIDGLDEIWYQPDFLDDTAESELLGVLEEVPDRPFEERDPRTAFAFTQLVIDGESVVGRREAAAGHPVWFDGRARAGLPMLPIFDALARRAERWLAELVPRSPTLSLSPLTSVYVDRYPPHGRFVPHQDRGCYGPVVVGISAGPGSCRLRFAHSDEMATSVDIVLAPRSLYAFFGPIRWEPWTHEVVDTTDVRYGVTFRSPAAKRRPTLS